MYYGSLLSHKLKRILSHLAALVAFFLCFGMACYFRSVFVVNVCCCWENYSVAFYPLRERTLIALDLLHSFLSFSFLVLVSSSSNHWQTSTLCVQHTGVCAYVSYRTYNFVNRQWVIAVTIQPVNSPTNYIFWYFFALLQLTLFWCLQVECCSRVCVNKRCCSLLRTWVHSNQCILFFKWRINESFCLIQTHVQRCIYFHMWY